MVCIALYKGFTKKKKVEFSQDVRPLSLTVAWLIDRLSIVLEII